MNDASRMTNKPTFHLMKMGLLFSFIFLDVTSSFWFLLFSFMQFCCMHIVNYPDALSCSRVCQCCYPTTVESEHVRMLSSIPKICGLLRCSGKQTMNIWELLHDHSPTPNSPHNKMTNDECSESAGRKGLSRSRSEPKWVAFLFQTRQLRGDVWGWSDPPKVAADLWDHFVKVWIAFDYLFRSRNFGFFSCPVNRWWYQFGP